MKLLTIFLGAACALALTSDVRSQAVPLPRTQLQQVQAMKTQNALLLEKQAATLQKLEAMRLQAQQIKFLGKRS